MRITRARPSCGASNRNPQPKRSPSRRVEPLRADRPALRTPRARAKITRSSPLECRVRLLRKLAIYGLLLIAFAGPLVGSAQDAPAPAPPPGAQVEQGSTSPATDTPIEEVVVSGEQP